MITLYIKALKLGAWDYVTKPTRMPVLLNAVDRALERVRLIKENRDYRQLRATLEALQQDEEVGRQIQFQLLPINNLKYSCRPE
ncbi:MAG: sigma-B regulation protein RsbU (phosphoserine phosphatase) [Granulosicoccus sp.]|jgi:sigma-B regulation protein RsbU (phosphoserine phosphatase)